jgi:hypothetical protein
LVLTWLVLVSTTAPSPVTVTSSAIWLTFSETLTSTVDPTGTRRPGRCRVEKPERLKETS